MRQRKEWDSKLGTGGKGLKKAAVRGLAAAAVLLLAFAAYRLFKTRPRRGADQVKEAASFSVEEIGEFDELKAVYTGQAYEGDRFDPKKVSVESISSGGSSQSIHQFDWEGAETIGGKSTYTIFTSYGETGLTVDPILIQSCVAEDGNYYAGSEFSGTIRASYADGTVRGIRSSDVSFPNGSLLTAGVNQIPFDYQGCHHTLYVEAVAGGRIAEAKAKSQGEIQSSVYNSITDTIFMTVSNMQTEGGSSYHLTHIVLSRPDQLHVGFPEELNGSYLSMDAAAARFGWLWGVGVDRALESQTYGAAATAEGGLSAGCLIRGGRILAAGNTTGDEICLTAEGALFSPPPGLTAQDLLDQKVTDTISVNFPLLIQDGRTYTETLRDAENESVGSAVGMVRPGEYYVVTADGMGLTLTDAQEILSAKNCAFARPVAGGSMAGLYYRTTPIVEAAGAVGDAIYLTDVQ